MGVLKNPRHERFAVLVASGKTQADAYRAVYPKSVKWQEGCLHREASVLHRKVLGRVNELKEASAAKASIQKDEAVAILAEALRATPAEVKDTSRFAQEMTIDPVTGKVTIKLPNKVAVFSELAKALAWYAPEKVEQTVRFKPDARVFSFLRGDTEAPAADS